MKQEDFDALRTEHELQGRDLVETLHVTITEEYVKKAIIEKLTEWNMSFDMAFNKLFDEVKQELKEQIEEQLRKEVKEFFSECMDAELKEQIKDAVIMSAKLRGAKVAGKVIKDEL